MMYVRYPLSLRNGEDILAERGIDIRGIKSATALITNENTARTILED